MTEHEPPEETKLSPLFGIRCDCGAMGFDWTAYVAHVKEVHGMTVKEWWDPKRIHDAMMLAAVPPEEAQA